MLAHPVVLTFIGLRTMLSVQVVTLDAELEPLLLSKAAQVRQLGLVAVKGANWTVFGLPTM